MNYNFTEIERKWQEYWSKKKTFRADNNSEKPKFYVLDMFPYPSGKGLHVGHPLGYIASDIYSRYKRLKGYNVLHPMGYDAFGLPAEQYAIETGQHPAIITQKNIKRYREQMDKLGFSYDWDREVKTCDAEYYKWTQWIFLKLFNSWYNPETDRAEPIDTLIPKLKNYSSLSEKEKSDILMNYRLAYLSSALVNWCPKLGTVLANEEVKDGLSDRGGYPVERRLMPQWSLRITAYADRLLNGLEKIDWSESIKEAQRNWIGRSEGSSLEFRIQNSGYNITVFTTRPDTTFGVTFLTLAPENDLVEKITTKAQKQIIDEYIQYAKNRSERERQADVKNVTGQFTGAYAIHPFSGEKLPVWIGDYVLPGYGTGAVMGVPAHDTRDFAFAKHFGLEIKKVISPDDKSLESEECFDTYDGCAVNSGFINGLQVRDAIKKIISEIEKRGLGRGQTLYRLRDAIFGRQRYWGEPIPIYYKGDTPYAMDESELPLILPEVDKYLPTESGEPPLANAKDWKYKNKFEYEKTTMPGWAGSSWYYLRYMDAQNKGEFVSKEAVNYWRNVDLYIGGAEHATGHLLYVRFWTKFLFDMGYLPFDEPAKKLINQGMILGENGEKMSKSKGNIINPDELIEKYGADTLRMYEMFIGPLEQHKPWDTKGIEGVSRFLKKLWRLYHDEKNNFNVSDEEPTGEELKILHKAIKKIKEDIERYSFNTGVSAMMICVNDLTELSCNKKTILQNLLIIVSPYAPHIAEELWSLLRNTESISKAAFPGYDEKYLIEMTYNYPVSFNGKMRFTIELPLSLPAEEIERAVLTCERSKKWLNGKKPGKVIIVPKKVVNIVV